MKKMVPIAFALLLLGVGCGASQPSSTPSTTSQTQAPADTLPQTFAFTDVKVGDVIEGLKVTKIEAADTQQSLSADNVAITFDGEKSVTGQLSQNDEFGVYCLHVADSAPLPRLKENTYGADFCFRQNKAANAVLAEKDGKSVTVTIKNYEVVYVKAVPDTENLTANVADLKL